MMKKTPILISIFLSMFYISSLSQAVYIPSKGSVTAKPIAPSAGVPTDARSYFYDSLNFRWRPYLSTAEVLSFLSSQTLRKGHFPIFVNTGGTLLNGVITGGSNKEYWFKDGVSNADLVEKTGGNVTSGTVAQIRALSTETGKAYQTTGTVWGQWDDTGLSDGAFADDGALYIITANNHLLKRRISTAINPLFFGADPSGVVNASPAIQAAINAAGNYSLFQSPQDPSEIVVTEGIYKIKNGLTMPKGVSIKAIGKVVFLLDSLTAGEYAISMTNFNTTRKVEISGITFTDNQFTGTKKGIFVGTHDNLIAGNKFYGLSEGIKIDGFNGNVIRDNFFYNHKIGIYLYGFASQTYIENNDFFAGLSTGTASIKLNDVSSPTPLQSVFITNNWFENNTEIPDILGRNCGNIFISKFWAEDYNQPWNSPRIDIDQMQGLYPLGNISINEGRIVLKAGTKTPIRINGSSVTVEGLDIHQDNEQPTLEFKNSAFVTVKQVRFQRAESEYEGMGYGVNIKGGVKVVNEDIIESTSQPWAVGGIQLRDGQNLFYDSEFKNGHNLVPGGGTPPTVTLDNTTGALDSSSAKVAFPASAAFASDVRHSKFITVATGQNVRIAFWGKTDGMPRRIIAKLAGVAALQGTDIYLTNKWKKFYLAVDSVGTPGAYYLYFQTYGSPTGINFWLDDLQAEVGSNVNDFSTYVPNTTAGGEVYFGKGVQLPAYYMGQAKFDRGTAPSTNPNEKRGSIRWNDLPINGSPVGWVTTTKGLSRGFGQVLNVDLEWIDKSPGVTENNLNGLTLASSNTSFGNVARSKDVFSANAGVLTFKTDRLAYGGGAQSFIGFTVNTTFTGWQQLILGVYYSPTGLTPVSTAFGLGDPISGVEITDYIRLRPTSVNTYIDKSSDGINWQQIYTPPVPIILNSDTYVGVDFNGSGGDKSINYITQSVNGEYDANFLLKHSLDFTLRNSGGSGYNLFYAPNKSTGIVKHVNFLGANYPVITENDSTLFLDFSDFAHLATTQTLTGQKTFSASTFFSGQPFITASLTASTVPANYGVLTKDNSSGRVETIPGTSFLNSLTVLPEYSSNSIAVDNGLTNGQFYRTGDVVKQVHP